MTLVGDQGAVEEFAADASDEAFVDGVGPRCPHRCSDDPDVDSGEDRVERCGEFGLSVSVSVEEPEPPPGVFEVHGQVAGSWVSRAGWGRGDPEEVHAAVGVLDDEEHVKPVQGAGSR